MTLTLFRTGNFILHSGAESKFKIDTDALEPDDWATLALIASSRVGPFGSVEGVLRGGLSFAVELERYATSGPPLIADDVLTTGTSMEQQRAGRDALGVVVFARADTCPGWITPLFTLAVGRPASPRSHANLIRLLHQIDGHLGLAVHRAEGARMEWREEAADLITRIRMAIKDLSR